MSLVPVEGQTYRYTGGLRSHRGLYGVASNIYPVGRLYRLTLSNHADWARCGLAPSLECLSSEIIPADSAEPLHPALPSVRPAMSLATINRLASEEPSPTWPPSPASPPSAPRQDESAFTGPEKELVNAVTDWLTENGFEWAVAGQRKAKGSGTTEGFPDLWVRHPVWPRGLWVAIEIKTATGTLSDEQERLHKRGGSHVGRSVVDVAEVLAPLHEAMRGWHALAAVVLKGLSPMLPPI